MTAIALAERNLFSIVTTGDRGARSPSWKALLAAPRPGDAHIDYAADTPTQRNIWAARLDEAVMRAEKPVLLVANGASCYAAAWWARLSPASYVSRVAGALLFDPVGRDADPDLADRFASPNIALPFASAVVRGSASRRGWADAHALAHGWGSGLLELPGRRMDAASMWGQAHELLMRTTAKVVEARLRVAGAVGVDASS